MASNLEQDRIRRYTREEFLTQLAANEAGSNALHTIVSSVFDDLDARYAAQEEERRRKEVAIIRGEG